MIFLEQRGYEVFTTNNGSDAIDLCKSQVFDIVFLDENMPGLSGLEVLSEIKMLQPALPVVMITKSEEENIMDQAIGEKIADYLIKPVNPNQILLTLKKHIHQREIVEEHTNTMYREEFQDISYMINTASTIEEWMAICKMLTKWELNLQDGNESLRELLAAQGADANNGFARFISQHYEQMLSGVGRPIMSPDIFKTRIFPLLDAGEKVFFVVIDNFRYDQWKVIQPLLSDVFTVKDEELCCTILPTSTGYARNAIFSGLMPLQLKEMFPQYWVDESDEEGMNLHEKELIQTQLDRYRKHYSFTYNKINESDYCERVIQRMHGFQSPLNVVVLNFIDMLSHSRTESKMMRELAGQESAYMSLTRSWFEHSPTLQLFRSMAELGYKVILTTDHGTKRVKNPVLIIGDKNTNTNLRYKGGKSLSCKSRDVIVFDRPAKVGLPSPNISSSYVFCTGEDFFGYPNNFNYYASYYRDTFQHGGVSIEEMLVPLITLEPK